MDDANPEYLKLVLMYVETIKEYITILTNLERKTLLKNLLVD